MTFFHKRHAVEAFSNGVFETPPCTCLPTDRHEATTLTQAEVGSRVEICCLEGEGPMVRRLAEMGFITGTEVEVIRKAPMSDPVEYQLRGYLISLRREEADHIRVRLCEPASTPVDPTEL